MLVHHSEESPCGGLGLKPGRELAVCACVRACARVCAFL